MGIRADWHLDSAASPADGFDPFELADSSTMVFEPGGPPITLDTPEPELRSRLEMLLSHEGRLDARGITCPLKDLPGASCVACPVNHADDINHRICALCRVGVQQEQVAMTLIAKRIADQGAPVAA